MSSNSLRAFARSLRFRIDRLRAKSTYKKMFTGNIEHLTFSKSSHDRPHVLFVTSNGAGMGHITRCLAIARSGREGFEASFVTLSTSAEVIGRQGFEYIQFASAGTAGQAARVWNNNFYQFFKTLTRKNHFDAVVFDGTWIYRGIRDVLDENSDLKLIWLRRGLWKKSATVHQLPEMEAYCSRVLTPWDIGEQLDQGPLAQIYTHTPVRGIVLSSGDLLDRETALEALDLDKNKKYVLVQLGAGNINDISDIRSKVTDSIKEHSRGEVITVIASSPISNREQRDMNSITIRKYPLSPYLRGFEFIVSAAGYNSIHEIAKWDIPSLVIPNLASSTDDQLTRANALYDGVNHFTALSDTDIDVSICALLRKPEVSSDGRGNSANYSELIDSGDQAAQEIIDTIRF